MNSVFCVKSCKFLVAFCALTLLVGCTNPDGTINKQQTGTLSGALVGGLVGSQFGGGSGRWLGAAVGAGAGALVGNMIGANLTKQDRIYQQRAYNQAMEHNPSGSQVSWRNPDSNTYGTFTPTRTYHENGMYCREFTQKVVIGGKTEQGVGHACRNPDGSWNIMN